MHTTNKYWEPDKYAPHQQNLFGLVEFNSRKSEKILIASYRPLLHQGWEWQIYVFNNYPDMQEHGICRTEEQAREAVQYYINLG